jgi:23S rRNA pseudouridine2605 synthase
MRINRFLAASGLGSRRSCEELILAGRVTVNGQICQNLATEVSEEDFVKVGSKRVRPEKHFYVLLHKPRGYLCTASDTHDRRTIFDLLPAHWPRLFHVGRLDRDSEGLLILTNDGDLGLKLTHPRFKIEKEYEVLLDRPYDAAADTPRLLRGVNIEGGRAKVAVVRQLSPVLLRIVLRQGMKRQIRLMLYKVGYEVKRLIRTRIGGLRLTELRAGEWRALTDAEVKGLLSERPAASKETGKEAGEGPGRGGKPKWGREGTKRREEPKGTKSR